MHRLFTVQELLQGIPAVTMLTLTYRPVGYILRLYPSNHTHTGKIASSRQNTNRYLPLTPNSKRTKTIPLSELLDDFLLEVSPTERATAYDATVAHVRHMLNLNPLFAGEIDGLALHWMLQYADTHAISYHTFAECIQKPKLIPTPAAFKAAGAPAVIEVVLTAEWELRNKLPTLSYLLRNPATKSKWREVPVAVKIETTNSSTPTTGTLQLGYGTDCPGSTIHLQDEILLWLQKELDGIPIFYNKTQSSPLKISIPTP